MRYQYYLILFIAFLSIKCSNGPNKIEDIAIIPQPQTRLVFDGTFQFDDQVSLKSDSELTSVASYFKELVSAEYQIHLDTLKKKKQVVLSLSPNFTNEESYELTIDSKQILISAKNERGVFYGIQSLRQLFPSEANQKKSYKLPLVYLNDKPEFAYRGMHLDVARHMYSVDFIKKYIDMMSRLKMNTFHWHLTEDQGWRIEIKKYPKLQEIAAFRKETLIGHYSDQPHQFDGKKYGGFYTQEEIKEIVAYAQQRQVTIIPEIEMPGHSQAAIAAYPELGCTGKQLEVATKWGVFEEVYCPKESTFQFLEDVIDEVIELFPGKYIHIGGDEAPKTRWKNCNHCQKLIKEKGLKDEHGLQSYFIQRMEKYINSKGKQIIGWDEILEGGLAPNATVMSWRGTKGAVDAAKDGHDVILTPTSHCYFDYYQSDNENEPLAIGGFLPLKKVYNFNPIPEELTSEESKYVLGAQGNVWTEYMSDEKKVEYMAFPRMIALSEAVWTSEINKNYSGFIKRLEIYQKRLDQLDVNYANHIYEVKGKLKNSEGKLSYQLTATSDTYPIYYSLDSTYPNTEYKGPIIVDSSMNIKAVVKDSDKVLGNVFEQNINLHKGVGAKITINKEPHPSYNAGGKEALINGISGNNKRYGDAEWLGFWGEDIEITIDLGKFKRINSLSTRFHNGNGQWIYAPKNITIRYDLKDGRVIHMRNKESNNDSLLVNFSFPSKEYAPSIKELEARYITISIPNYGIIPKGKQGADNKAWTFVDEIIIE